MKLILSWLTIFILVNFSLNAQQWMDEKYAYDSIMNVTYGSSTNFLGETESHEMDIYLPICGDSLGISRRPLLLFIHGGAFLSGNKDETNIQNLCKRFAKRGYVTAALNYRLGFVSDDIAWTCNYPNYSCVFATDSAEWFRAYYRAIQDGKGALRYLINRNNDYRIDTNNVFLAGESAGAFISLGISLLDTPAEKFPEAFATNSVPAPHSSSWNCSYNTGNTFPASISRPDLGSIDGSIEPSSIQYTIKGVGNFFGGMMSNLLAEIPAGKVKPAIYSFHQPCDLVVPIDSAKVYAGLSWCMTNGYNCYGIANTPKVYGSRGFSALNSANNYGYTIENHFTTLNFPFNFLFGPGSCADQINNPCHGYDNFTVRSNELAAFFAPLVSTSPICDTSILFNDLTSYDLASHVSIFPNPANDKFTLRQLGSSSASYSIIDHLGRTIQEGSLTHGDNLIELNQITTTGLYGVRVRIGQQTVHRTISILK